MRLVRRGVFVLTGLALLVSSSWLGSLVVGPVALPTGRGEVGATAGIVGQGLLEVVLRLVVDFVGIGLIVSGFWRKNSPADRPVA